MPQSCKANCGAPHGSRISTPPVLLVEQEPTLRRHRRGSARALPGPHRPRRAAGSTSKTWAAGAGVCLH